MDEKKGVGQKIIVALQGGLGNQLFQYAAGLAVKRAGGSAATLWLAPPEENTHSARDYRGMFGEGRALEEGGEDLTPPLVWWPAEPFMAWTPEDLLAAASAAGANSSAPPALYMRGFFQYLPAVASVLPFIRHEILKRIAERRLYVQKKYGIDDPATAAFVHVRRGDYVELEKEGFWNLGADYYRPALQRIRTAAAGGPQRILLLSDDLAWCSQQPWITEEGFEAADEPDELTALALMSMCGGGAVIANSTFSWWGAYLSAASTVVYPSLWLKDWAPELFPAGWICQKLQPRPPAT